MRQRVPSRLQVTQRHFFLAHLGDQLQLTLARLRSQSSTQPKLLTREIPEREHTNIGDYDLMHTLEFLLEARRRKINKGRSVRVRHEPHMVEHLHILRLCW